MRQSIICALSAIAFALLATSDAGSQTSVKIWPGVAPGSEGWSWKEQVFHVAPYGTIINDVVTPTLTVFLPAPSSATGTGIVIAPGGACVALTMESEGYDAARWFQKHGIAAFVLKYRLTQKTWEGPPPPNMDEDIACKYGIADGIQAIRVVRKHAAEWKLSARRIGILGFSAGGMIASETLLQKNVAARPDFVALIYGAPFSSMPTVPRTKLAPTFMAWSQDDDIGGYAMVRFYRALEAAGDKPEAHIFNAGGHGFGMKNQGTTSDHWIEEFHWWLQAQGFIAKPH